MTNKKNQKFERRHYELIAKILGAVKSAKFTREIKGDFRADGYYHSIEHVTDLFINHFNSDNPNFDPIRFRNEIEGAIELARDEPNALITQI